MNEDVKRGGGEGLLRPGLWALRLRCGDDGGLAHSSSQPFLSQLCPAPPSPPPTAAPSCRARGTAPLGTCHGGHGRLTPGPLELAGKGCGLTSLHTNTASAPPQ